MNVGEIVDYSTLDAETQHLLRESAKAREYSYSPYSHFKVGAALLCLDGTVFKGCNVENASYGATICAERTAIAKAVSEGRNKFKALTIVADGERDLFTTPCGICRQTLVEFGNLPVYSSRSDMYKVLKTTLSNLLPLAFK